MDAYTYMSTVSRLEHYEQLARQMAKSQRREKTRDRSRTKVRPAPVEGNVLLVPTPKNA